MMKTKLAKAISMAVAGVALTAGSSSAFAAATTMYNTFNTTNQPLKNLTATDATAVFPTTTLNSSTDGWTRMIDTTVDVDTYASGWESNGNNGTIVPWVGTTGNALPLGYTGSSHLNWAVQLGAAGDSAEISAADSAKYAGDVSGFASAEIDTGGGAWRDTSASPTGWKHQTDIGLIKSDVTQRVHINLVTLGNLTPATFSKFGVTIFQGMDTNTGNYLHHGSWNNASNPYTKSNPFGTTGLTNIKYSDNVDGVSDIWFDATGGQIYSIYLGGVDFSAWNTGLDNYKMTITTSAVPVPGAIWLFGSAMAGLIGFGGRRKALAA